MDRREGPLPTVEAFKSFTEEPVPTKYEVCPTCDGHGTHVNPAIDSHGLGAEDFYDEDFAEAYFSGAYDQDCHECNGKRVVEVINENLVDPEVLESYYEYVQDVYADRRVRFMESGGY